MKVNSSNYYEAIKQIGIENLSPALKKAHEFINLGTKGGTNWNIYQTHRKIFDMQFEAIERLLNKKQKPQSQKKEEKTKEKTETAKPVKPYPQPLKTEKHYKSEPSKKQQTTKEQPTSRKPKKFEKPHVKGKGVELISPEVNFIKRYALLHGKTKTKDQILAFIRALQKAIVEKRIRKTSKFAGTIGDIQKALIKLYKKMRESIYLEFDHKDLYRYYKMAGAEHLIPSIRFIKSYLNMQGKDITKEKANGLYSRIHKAMENKKLNERDRYFKHIRIILNSLKEFLDQKGKEVLSISETQLNGLEGVLRECGCHHQTLNGIDEPESEPEPEDDGVMTVDEARNAKFRPVELTGDWLRLIGKMCLPTQFLVYGLGGSGKTSFVLLFTQYLASLGYRILYVAREQYNTPTFTELLNRLNIVVGDNFKIVKDLQTLNPKDFDFVVLDSKDDMDIQLHSFVKLKEKYPTQSFIMISQGTKNGDFTGTGRWRNVVDVMVYAENGVIKTGLDKNRWGGTGELKLF